MPRQSKCQACGYTTRLGSNEYHPYAFCVLVKAGLDPWEIARKLVKDLVIPTSSAGRRRPSPSFPAVSAAKPSSGRRQDLAPGARSA